MILRTPEQIVSDPHEAELNYLNLQNKRHNLGLGLLITKPDEALLKKVADAIEKFSSICFTTHQVLDILALYPTQKAWLITYKVIGSEIMDITANFLLATYWPKTMNPEDTEVFIKKLQNAAAYMGYKIKVS